MKSTGNTVSVETNSFKQVSSYLDAGGSFYLYLGAEQWLSGLSGKMADWRQVVTALPNMTSNDRDNVDRLFGLLSGLVKVSGMEEVSAVGASGIEVEKGTYLNKMMLHHYAGRNEGLLWSMFGKAPHPLTSLDYLPENTALAFFTDLDADLLWKTLKQQIQEAAIPDLSKGLEQGTTQLERNLGVSLDKMLGSLGGELGFVLVLNGEKTIPIPQPGGAKIEIPEPALGLVLKVKDDTIFDVFDKFLQKNPNVIKTDKSGLKMRAMPIPGPVPSRLTVARAGDYLFLASQDKMVTEMLAAKEGKGGLKNSQEFKAKAKGIALEGNGFAYVSPEISRTINHVIDSIADFQAASGKKDQNMELIQRLLGNGKEAFSFTVASNTREGWFVQGNSSQHPAAAFLGQTLIGPVIAGFALPALAKSKNQAQRVACVNNLKQIGLAGRLYANDHGELLPKDFASLTNELSSPRVLVCPGDQKTAKAGSWAEFNFANVSYELVSPGARTDDPQKVFVRCPIHNNTCRVDGSVQSGGQGGGGARKTRVR